ncbi:MAG: hypothetical protein LC104_01710 [Bacteroidales bacterium]|nr:hypothetical protein [Bacteroidales bacterium]
MLGKIAYSKVNDVAWVQAAFRGERVGFEPYVRLWIKEGKDATGLTVLMHNYPKDAEPSSLPDACVRWSEWQEKPAVQGFVSADDKPRYVRDDMPVPCVLRFYRAEEIGIDRLMERTSALLAGGVAFAKMDRPELDRREVSFEFCDGALFYQFSFSPGSVSNGPLERLVQEWLDAARSLQSLPDHPPDDGFQIAYRESIWEQVARYGESH